MNDFISLNPFTEKQLAKFKILSPQALEEVLSTAHTVRHQWSAIPVNQRGGYFLKLADLIRSNSNQLAELAVLEMGKPFKEALAEVMKCTTACEYYANEAEALLRTEVTTSDNGKQVELRYDPMGVVLGIFPWNFPYWQIIRSAVPVLMAGNTMLVKPAPNVPQCALALQAMFLRAGFPEGVVQTIFVDELQIATLINDERIKACTLTGSEKAGSIVAMQAARVIKKTVLELGGSDPFIVLDDVDIDAAVKTAITARFQNNGQSCIASKRFILHQRIADRFIEKLISEVSSLKLGNPMDSIVNIGPLARRDLRDKLKSQVDESVKMGARVIYQHPYESREGYFFPPTILDAIPEDAPAYKEELFGPVISIFRVNNDADAIRIANDTLFGLGASVWSSDKLRADAIAEKLDCGQVFINGLVKSHTRFPFGGVKHSGIGRELGESGIKEFCHVKTIWRDTD